MPPLTMQEKVLSRGRPVPLTALVQVPLKPLWQVHREAVLRPPSPGVPGGRVSPLASMAGATYPLLLVAAPGGCPAVWSIYHHRGYCSPKYTVPSPHPCGLSCGGDLLGRPLPPGLRSGSPVTGSFNGSG